MLCTPLNLRGLHILLLAGCLLLPGCAPASVPLPPTGSSFTAAFSPRGASLELALSCIRAAERNILVAAYSFTSKPVALALAEARQRGVSVQVVADKKGNSSRYTAVADLVNHGVPVRLNGQYAIHHHKFMVIDGRHVQTGSFNYSAAAVDKNAENVLVLWNMPELADQYATEWRRLWDEAEPLPARY
jgi:phosphatidylserine/phosphatidylglycerophosphate/cardiolipin synthase-like enzyme